MRHGLAAKFKMATGPQFIFSLREALSDVANMKILGAEPGIALELDYPLAAGAGLGSGYGSGAYGEFPYGEGGGLIALLDSFLTPASLPNATVWQAGVWAVSLAVVAATDIAFTVSFYRADADGNILEQIGSTPALQTASAASEAAPEIIIFTVEAPEIQANATDRILLQLGAQNTDEVNAHDFSFMASLSGVATPATVPLELGNEGNTFRRGKFLGIFFRPGEGAPYFNDKGQNLETYSLP
jgi:hypothetical protein